MAEGAISSPGKVASDYECGIVNVKEIKGVARKTAPSEHEEYPSGSVKESTSNENE